MASVAFKDVNKIFGKDVKAVQDLSLDIHDGEFMVLVGPSGCGKTTALRIVAGLEEASGGDVLIGSQRVNDVPPKDRDIAMQLPEWPLLQVSSTSASGECQIPASTAFRSSL